MKPFAFAMLILFVAAWFVGVGAWLYGTRFFFPMVLDHFRVETTHDGYKRKVLIGYAIFVAAAIFAIGAGFLAQLAGAGKTRLPSANRRWCISQKIWATEVASHPQYVRCCETPVRMSVGIKQLLPSEYQASDLTD
jgi:hypothetical protein